MRSCPNTQRGERSNPEGAIYVYSATCYPKVPGERFKRIEKEGAYELSGERRLATRTGRPVNTWAVRTRSKARGQRLPTRACHVYAVLLCCSSLFKLVHQATGHNARARAATMENCPPYRLARRSSLMHSKPPSKSSPAKRDATRILTPQSNQVVAPADVFNTGLLTPQASQNTFDSDAAISFVSTLPEDLMCSTQVS